MKAVVLTAQGKLSYTDIDLPDRPGPEWVLLEVIAAGVCGSDLPRAYDGGAYGYPLVMGHELSCIVAEGGVHPDFAKGRRVAVFPVVPCARCSACQTGDYAQCESYDYLGSRRQGGFAELMWAPAANLFPVPDQVESDHAAMTEPCAVALHAAGRAEARVGESAVVYGGGPIGNLVAQWLSLRGCDPVMVVDIDRRKLETAEAMGMVPVDAGSGDAVEAVMERTGGHGADVSIEAVGLPKTVLQAIQGAARFGRVVVAGNLKGEFRVGESDFSSILRRELAIHGTWNSKVVPRGSDEWSTALRYIGGGIDVEPLISHRVPLARAPEVMASMRTHNDYFSKVILHPKESP